MGVCQFVSVLLSLSVLTFLSDCAQCYCDYNVTVTVINVTNEICKDTSGTVRIRTQSLFQTSKGKMDKDILTNNKITKCKPDGFVKTKIFNCKNLINGMNLILIL